MKSTFLTIAAAALLITPSLLAQDAPAPGGNRPGGPGAGRGGFGGTPEERVKRLTDQLTLTTEQADKIKAIYTKYDEETKALREKGRDATPEERTKLREFTTKQQEEVAAILTDEQKKKQQELRPGRGQGGPGGQGGQGGQGRRGQGGAGGAGGGAAPAPAPAN